MIEKRGQQFKFRFFDDTDHQRMKALAQKNDRTLAYVVNQAIKEFLNKHEEVKNAETSH